MQCKFDFRCDGSVIHNYNFPVWLLRWKVEYDNLYFLFFVNVVVKVGLACQDTEPKGSNTSFLLGKPEDPSSPAKEDSSYTILPASQKRFHSTRLLQSTAIFGPSAPKMFDFRSLLRQLKWWPIQTKKMFFLLQFCSN